LVELGALMMVASTIVPVFRRQSLLLQMFADSLEQPLSQTMLFQ